MGRIGRAVVVVIHADERRPGPARGDRLATTLLALVSGADAWFDVLNVELAGAAAAGDQRLAADLTALDIVRADI